MYAAENPGSKMSKTCKASSVAGIENCVYRASYGLGEFDCAGEGGGGILTGRGSCTLYSSFFPSCVRSYFELPLGNTYPIDPPPSTMVPRRNKVYALTPPDLPL